MTVLIDPNTGSADLHHLLPCGGSVLSDLILVGSNNRADAAWFGNGPDQSKPPYIGVERKRLGDALQCMQDGRLAEQLRGLVSTYDHVWIVIEDEIRSNPDTGLLEKLLRFERKTKKRNGNKYDYRWVTALYGSKRKLMWRDFHHWLCSLTYVATELTGVMVRVWFTKSARETAEWIWSEYNWWQKDWKDHKSLNVFNTSGPGPKIKPCTCDHPKLSHDSSRGKCARCGCDRYEQARIVAPSIKPPFVAEFAKVADGVGWDRALALADKFASVREMVNADATEHVIKGVIGKQIAEQIVEQWNRERTLLRRR